jgi:4-nitrophenyl phosphatase
LDALVCDLDGVVYRGEEAIPGAPEAFRRLREGGLRLVFCTNNSRPTVDQYVEKLNRLGVQASHREIVSSGVVTADFLRSEGPASGTVYVVGGLGAVDAVTEAGLEVVDGEEAAAADVVVVGWDRDFTWDKMRIAAAAVRSGALFVATNSDATFPAPDGLWPGAGAILASIERASGREALVMGKPSLPMMEAAAKRLEGAERIAMVGDRNDTDLAGGRAMGWTTILVLTGVTDAAAVASLHPAPDLVVDSISELE